MSEIDELKMIVGGMIETYDQAPGKVFVQVVETLARHGIPLSDQLNDEANAFKEGLAFIIEHRKKELLERIHNGYLKVKHKADKT